MAAKKKKARPASEPEPTPPGSNLKWVALAAGIAAAAVAAYNCEGNDARKPAASAPGPAREPAATAAPERAGGGEVHWTKPAAWKEVPSTSSMRVATYQVPRVQGDPEDGELSVIVAGGATDANIARWEAQFGGSKAKTAQKNAHGLNVTTAEIVGDFAGGGPMMGGDQGKKAGWMMLAAVVDVSGGQHYFFKLTGPRATVENARKDFDALVDSLSP